MSSGDHQIKGGTLCPVFVISIPGELGQKNKIAKFTKVDMVEGTSKNLHKTDDDLVRKSPEEAVEQGTNTTTESSMKNASTSSSLNGQNVDKESFKRNPFQKFCNMAHISCSGSGRISYNCSTIPVFCTVRNIESLIPSTSAVDDLPAYILIDHRSGIKGIMADNLLPVSYLISHSSFHGNNRVAVFMPDKSQVTDDNKNVVPWHVQKVMLSPYLASHTDPFPGSELVMLDALSDTFPTVDISCLDFEDIVAEIENSQEQACTTHYQYGPECSHFYYYLMLSKLHTINMASNATGNKFKLRINFVDKAMQLKKKLARAKKQKAKKKPAPSMKMTDDKKVNEDKCKK